MKASKKTAIKVAVGCIVAGALLSFVALLTMGFDFKEINTMKSVTNTYEIQEPFTNLTIDTEFDVRLLPSDDGVCKVVCRESDKITHRVTVEDQTMTISQESHRKWYDYLGLSWGTTELTVYLPAGEYGALRVSTMSGDVEIPDALSFSEAKIENCSGSVRFSAAVAEDLSIKTVSGDIEVRRTNPKNLRLTSTSGEISVDSAQLAGSLEAYAVSGDITLTSVSCQDITAETTSGEVELEQTVAAEALRIETVSGDIDLTRSDAASAWLKSTSGEVSGTLLTEKVFFTDTTSGSVEVPRTTGGGTCEIKTVSGDIEFSIVP